VLGVFIALGQFSQVSEQISVARNEKYLEFLNRHDSKIKNAPRTLILKRRWTILESNLQALKSQPGVLDEISFKFLNLLFDHDELSTEEVAASLGISKGMAEYHRDLLSQANMIQQTRVGVITSFESTPTAYGILPKGREYVVKNS
jgi:hypothetical protein